jgi:hypothetical protein
MNYLQLVNSVLRRLRESEVTTVQGSGNNNSYARLIGDYVNEAKAQVEDAWQWLALKQNLTITTVAGTSEYILNASKHKFRLNLAYNDTKDWELKEKPYEWMLEASVMQTAPTGSPAYFAYSGIDNTSDDVKIIVYPTPNAVETLKFYGVTRRAKLSADSDVLYLPERPVILLATAMAMEERGEDAGQQSINAYRLAQNALADEIAFDAARQPEQTIWYEV